MTSASRRDPAPPVIPDHEVIRCVGEGSYGRVWLARTVLGSWRAIKVVQRDSFENQSSYDREFAGVRRFEPISRNHPGFVAILHTGQDPAMASFHYVMELADDAAGGLAEATALRDGDAAARCYEPRTLSEGLAPGHRLPVADCVEIGWRLADALAHLHAEGLIHRDIKPSNIVFVRGQPKLADIGLVIEASQAKTFVGTEGYVAPEGPNSPQADVYSLGMVLYEAAMGMDRRSFPSPGMAMRHGPDASALRELNAVLLKACATRREERYPSAAEMASDLRLLRSGGSVEARDRRVRLLRAASQIAAITLAMVGSLWLGRSAWHNWTAGRVRAQVAHGRSLAAQGVRAMVADDLGAAAVLLAGAVPELESQPAEAALHRTRVRQILQQAPTPALALAATAAVSSLAFSQDGLRIVAGDVAGNITLWDSQSGAILGRLAAMGGPVEARFVQQGRRLLAVPAAGADPPGPSQAMRAVLLDGSTLTPIGLDVRDIAVAALSPDERTVAVVDSQRLHVRLIDAASGGVRHVLRGHRSSIRALAFSTDSKHLATGGGGSDRAVRIWRTSDGTLEGAPVVSAEDVKRLVFWPWDQRLLVMTGVGSVSAGVSVLGGPTPGLDLRVTRAAEILAVLEPQGLPTRRFLLSDEANGFSVRSLDDGQPVLPPLLLPGGHGISASISPDGSSVVAGSTDGWMRVWDLCSGAPRTPPMQLGSPVHAVAFSPDATRVAAGTHHGTVIVLDLTAPTDEAERLQIAGIPLSPPHPRFAFPAAMVAGDGIAVVMEVDGKPLPQFIDGSSGRQELIHDVPGMLPHGAVVAGHRARLWAAFNVLMVPDPAGCDVVLARQAGTAWASQRLSHPCPVGAARFTQDDSRLITIDREARVRVWRTADGSLEREVPMPHAESEDMVLVPGLSPDGQLACWTESPARSRLFFGRWNEERPAMRSHAWGASVSSYALHPTAPLAAVRTVDRRVHVLDLDRNVEVPLPTAQGSPLLANFVKWSPSARTLLVEAANGRLLLLDLDRATLIPVLGPQGGMASSCYNFSPDGRWLAASTLDGRAWAAEVTTGEPATPWLQHPEAIRFVAINAAHRLVTIDGKGTLRGWDLTPATSATPVLAEAAQRLSGRRLLGDQLEWMPSTLMASTCAEPRPTRPEGAVGLRRDPAGWHLSRAREADSVPRWKSGSFHVEQAAKIQEGPALDAAKARLAALAIPPRDPRSPEEALDLGAFYTHSFPMLARGELARVPRGHVVLQGIPFDLRGLVRLEPVEYGTLLRAEGSAPLGSLPIRSVSGIPVGRPCRRIHFLQEVDGRFRAQGEECARWRIHFADGSQREFPVLLGKHVTGWPVPTSPSSPRPSASHAPSTATVAWIDPGRGATNGALAHLCRVTWENPEPSQPIRSLDFMVGTSRSRAFVAAITVE